MIVVVVVVVQVGVIVLNDVGSLEELKQYGDVFKRMFLLYF